MKTFPAFYFICTGLLPLFGRAAPVDSIRINTVIYVVKIGEAFEVVTKGPARLEMPKPSEHWKIFMTPSKIKLGDEEITFNGETMARTAHGTTPSQLTVVQTPVFTTRVGRSAGMRISNPTEYFEKMPGGEFQLHQSSDDSPDTPHFDLTLTPRAVGPGEGYRIDCALDLAVVQSREKIPGVDLDVGRPHVATFHDLLTFEAEAGKWVCLLEKSEVGDYQLLVLLRAVPADGKALPAAGSQNPGPG